MTCSRCDSKELIFLFRENRHAPGGEYQYTWEYAECTECHLINIDQVALAQRRNKNEE